LINDTSDIRNPQFLIYPTVAYAPETSWEFGLSSVFVFYANRDTTNRLSEVNAFTFVTLEKQYGLWFDHALYSQNNNWFSLGRLRFQSFPMLYFGIGPNSPDEHLAQVNANLVQIKERVLRKVRKSLYTGLEIDYQQLSSVEFIPHRNELDEYPHGSKGSSNLGIGAGILYDNRHNILNVRKGLFSELAFINYHHAWGSDLSFTTVISDTRIYRPINTRDVLALQLLGQFNIGKAPFNQLALLGGESIMRGYYLGRYRDNNQLAAQVEYRLLPLPWSFTKRWGAAFFAGTGTVFNDVDLLSAKEFVWSAGGGLRFLLFPKKDIYTRLDVAFTREGTGIYLFIGEAF
jgi:outer membrane protein assembly factor BamA